VFWTRDRGGRSSCSQIFVKAPMERFFLKKFFTRVAYEKIKLKDGIDVKI
jgi:hypothetical protein